MLLTHNLQHQGVSVALLPHHPSADVAQWSLHETGIVLYHHELFGTKYLTTILGVRYVSGIQCEII